MSRQKIRRAVELKDQTRLAAIPMPLVRQIAGHSRESITSDVYSHVLLDEPEWRLAELRRAVARMTGLDAIPRVDPVLTSGADDRLFDPDSPANGGDDDGMEHSGLEPLTSWVRSGVRPSW